MVQLAVQLIQRQTGVYDPVDLEDRYETRLRAMIEAKVKGEQLRVQDNVHADTSNVIDLMAALKRSLGAPLKQVASTLEAAASPEAESPPCH